MYIYIYIYCSFKYVLIFHSIHHTRVIDEIKINKILKANHIKQYILEYNSI